jgi:hypothetical protein
MKAGAQVQAASGELYGAGTLQTTGANNLVRLNSLTISDTPEFYIDESKNGTLYDNSQEVVAVLPTFELEADFWNRGIENLLLAAFGYEDLSGPINYGTTEYSHLFTLDPDGKDQRLYTTAEAALASANVSFDPAYAEGDYVNRYLGQVAVEEGPADVKAYNCGVSSFNITSTSKEPVKITLSGTAEQVARDTTKAESAAWTAATGNFGNMFFLRHCTAKFGALGALATVSIFSFDIAVTHGQADDLVPTGGSNSGKSRSEPVSTGKTEITVTFQINKHDTIGYKTAEQAGTVYAMSLDFTRTTDRMILLLPHLQIESAEPEIEDGSKINIVAKAYLPTGADPFATERSISGTAHDLLYTTPLYMVLSNRTSTNSMRVN